MEQSGKLAGVYLLRSDKSNQVYVGSSKDILKRFKEHLNKLKQGKHHSRKLQEHYNAFNPMIELEILKLCNDEQLRYELEIRYILLHDSVNYGFNMVLDSKAYGTMLTRRKR